MVSREMGVTQQDIANELGLAGSTVSRALQGDRRVSEAIRRQVAQAAETLGYSAGPRRGGGGSRRFLAAFCDPGVEPVTELDAPAETFHFRLIHGLLREGSEAGMACHLKTLSNWSEFGQRVTPSELKRVEAVVLIGDPPDILVAQLVGNGHHVIIAEGGDALGEADCIGSDNLRGGRLAAAHFADRGHRRIGVIAGPEEVTSWQARLEGLQLEAFRRGIPLAGEDCRMSDHISVAAYERLLLQWLEAGDMPSALFVPAGVIGFAVWRALQRQGLRLPHDLSMVAFDDGMFTPLVRPALTRVATDPDAIGRAVAQRLESVFAGQRADPAQQVLLPVQFIEGRSVRDVNATSASHASSHASSRVRS
jgi:DNA-binding LacI/PurR family transcriptional regulator